MILAKNNFRCFQVGGFLALAGLCPATGAEEKKPPGAVMPFITFEAEAPGNKTTGKVIALAAPPTPDTSTPELEASGRSFVEIAKTGEFLEIQAPKEANGMVIRHGIPDAPEGGGIERTLSVYVNGTFRQKITLSSKYNWLYGQESGQNGQSNDPAAGPAHVFWDDTRFLIEGGLKAGDMLRLQKDDSDTADFYRIDLVDLEEVPPPLTPPAAGTYLSVTDFGANGADGDDDTAAFQKCIEAAKAQKKIVWIPPGTYLQSAKFTLDGVTVRGAGMWHTNIHGIAPSENFAGTLGFVLTGSGSRVSDMTILPTLDSETFRSRKSGKPFTTAIPVSNWSVENVWLAHTGVGFWLGGAYNGVVRGCRLYLTYADGINLNRGSSDNVVENNYVRGIGDDGVVILSHQKYRDMPEPVSNRNTLRQNTVVANWWGHNCNVDGGEGHVVEDNYFADNSRSACLTLNQTASYPAYAVTGVLVRRNVIVRGGGNHGGQRRGAIWINAGNETIHNAIFRDNEIRDPIFRGIHLYGSKEQETVFENNVIIHPGEDAIFIDGKAKGSGKFTANIVRDLNRNFRAFQNEAGPGYKAVLKDNSWQSSQTAASSGGNGRNVVRANPGE